MLAARLASPGVVEDMGADILGLVGRQDRGEVVIYAN